MHPVVLADILQLVLYEPVRDSHRRGSIAMKKHRRISLGEQMTLRIEHAACTVSVVVPAAIRAALRQDLL